MKQTRDFGSRHKAFYTSRNNDYGKRCGKGATYKKRGANCSNHDARHVRNRA